MLLILSSTFKLRNFDIGMKMMAIAPTLDIYLPYVCKVSIYRLVWGYCFIHSKGSAKT
nr:MAG TPA: hypothetical protein [Caudoviricetes sp.]